MDITKASDQDLQDVITLLKEVDLYEEGFYDHFHNFVVAREGTQLVGCAGLEIYDNIGLIRSVAVHPTYQKRGLGRKLVEKIQNFAKEKGLKKIYLFTETAEQFFSKLNYVAISREEDSPKLKQSTQFTLCASATFMEKELV